MTTVEIPVEAPPAPVAAPPEWRRHAAALAGDREVRRAAVAALLIAVQLCVWRFPFPGEVRLIGAIWRHPALLAEAAAVRLSGIVGALAGTLALALPLALAAWLLVPPWCRYARRAASAALALDLACAALAPWVAPLQGSLVTRTAQAAAAGWLGSPVTAAALLLAGAFGVIVVGFRLGPALRGAAHWGQGRIARGGEGAERALAWSAQRAQDAAAAGGARLRENLEVLRERRRVRAERAAAEPPLTPGGTWIEGAPERDLSLETDPPAGKIDQAVERVERAGAALRSALGYHQGSGKGLWKRWQKRWERRQPTSKA